MYYSNLKTNWEIDKDFLPYSTLEWPKANQPSSDLKGQEPLVSGLHVWDKVLTHTKAFVEGHFLEVLSLDSLFFFFVCFLFVSRKENNFFGCAKFRG